MKPIKQSLIAASALAAFLAPAAPVLAQHVEHAAVARAPASAKVAETGAALRDLWVGHVFWVRNVIVDSSEKSQASGLTHDRDPGIHFSSLCALSNIPRSRSPVPWERDDPTLRKYQGGGGCGTRFGCCRNSNLRPFMNGEA